MKPKSLNDAYAKWSPSLKSDTSTLTDEATPSNTTGLYEGDDEEPAAEDASGPGTKRKKYLSSVSLPVGGICISTDQVFVLG